MVDGMTPRNMHQQTLYLEPDKAALLDELAAETRIPKAVLLREAIDDLLAKHGKASSEFIDLVRDLLPTARKVAHHFRPLSNTQTLWERYCDEVHLKSGKALKILGMLR